MSVNDNISSKTVKQLQEFLKERGVSTRNKRKSQLIKLCEAAKVMDIG